MKILSFLNPQGWIGQIIILLFFVSIGFIGGLIWVEPCPPTTHIEIDNQNKVKKGGSISNGMELIVSDSTDCSDVIRSLSMKEIRSIRRE